MKASIGKLTAKCRSKTFNESERDENSIIQRNTPLIRNRRKANIQNNRSNNNNNNNSISLEDLLLYSCGLMNIVVLFAISVIYLVVNHIITFTKLFLSNKREPQEKLSNWMSDLICKQLFKIQVWRFITSLPFNGSTNIKCPKYK